jgi:hypothetical protein
MIVVTGLVIAALLILAWYAMISVRSSSQQTVAEAKAKVTQVAQPTKGTEGQLVHVVGPLELENETVYDHVLNLSFTGAKLRRQVQMYQWHKSISDNRHTYTADWSALPLSSSESPPAYQNPPWNRELQSTDFLNKGPVSVKGFSIPNSLLSSLSRGYAVPSDTLELPRFSEQVGMMVTLGSVYIYLTPHARRTTVGFRPEIGDYRVQYILMPSNAQVAVIGQQKGSHVVPWKDKVLLLSDTILDSDTLLSKLEVSTLTICACFCVLTLVLVGLGFAFEDQIGK